MLAPAGHRRSVVRTPCTLSGEPRMSAIVEQHRVPIDGPQVRAPHLRSPSLTASIRRAVADERERESSRRRTEELARLREVQTRD